MRVLFRLMGFVKPFKMLVVAGYLSMIGSAIFSLATPRLLGNAVDDVLSGGRFTAIIYFGLAIIGFSILRGVCAYFENYYRESLAQHVAYDVRNRLYDHLQGMSFAYHDKQSTGQLMTRATADVENIRMFVSFGVLRASYMAVLISAITVLMVQINWSLALISMAAVPFLTIRGGMLSTRMRQNWTRVQQSLGEIGTALQETLSGVRVVKAFARQDYEDQRYRAKSQELYQANLVGVKIQASNGPLMDFAFTFMTAIVLWWGGRQIIEGNLTVGQLTQFVFYLAMLQMPVRISTFVINQFSRAVSSGIRIFEILDAQSPVQEKPNGVILQGVKGQVQFDHVSFKYESASPVLSDITFDVKPGQVIALLGATGSGKSTVVHLIPRFYDVTGGRILIDGTDVRDVTFESLRNTVGIVQQDLFLFSATIRDNVAYGSTGSTPEQVEWACKIARLHDFILTLPEKYDTWVGERGITLSGGQKQRLAIARTVLRNPAVLILDDSTSSVDTQTEHLIRQALAELISGRTTFVIAQRLSTVKNADLTIVLERGRIVQRGSHEELLKDEKGIYRTIYEMQLRPQEEAEAAAASALEEARA